MDDFAEANKKAGFTTSIVAGTLTKNAVGWDTRFESASDSQEELNGRAKSERGKNGILRQSGSKERVGGGIQRTVEFEAVTSSRTTPTPTPTNDDEPFADRGGFY
jgi:hypothetical protein